MEQPEKLVEAIGFASIGSSLTVPEGLPEESARIIDSLSMSKAAKNWLKQWLQQPPPSSEEDDMTNVSDELAAEAAADILLLSAQIDNQHPPLDASMLLLGVGQGKAEAKLYNLLVEAGLSAQSALVVANDKQLPAKSQVRQIPRVCLVEGDAVRLLFELHLAAKSRQPVFSVVTFFGFEYFFESNTVPDLLAQVEAIAGLLSNLVKLNGVVHIHTIGLDQTDHIWERYGFVRLEVGRLASFQKRS